jgi:hypothetical protein
MMRIILTFCLALLNLNGCAPLPLAASAGVATGSYVNQKLEPVRGAYTAPVVGYHQAAQPIRINPYLLQYQVDPFIRLIEMTPAPKLDSKLKDKCTKQFTSIDQTDYSIVGDKKSTRFEKPSYILLNDSNCESAKLPSLKSK